MSVLKACIKVTYGDFFKKKTSCKLMFKFDVNFRNIETIYQLLLIRKSIKTLLLIWYHIRHSENNQKASTDFVERLLDAVCTHATSSAASRDSAVKLTTDSYQFWVAH